MKRVLFWLSIAIGLTACSKTINNQSYDNEGPAAYPEALTPSPSGMMDLTEEGHVLLKEIQIKEGEDPASWISRIKKRIPQLKVTEPVSLKAIQEAEAASKLTFPAALKQAWSLFGSLKFEGDVLLCSPQELIRFNEMYPKFLPEIPSQKIFFGGMDGHNFALSMSTEELTVSDWEHETGWSPHTESSIYRHLAERIAWYVTYSTPFCYEHGYVSPDKYK